MILKRWNPLTAVISVLLSTSMLLTACFSGSSGPNGTNEPPNKDKQVTIKVMFGYDEDEFYRDYGTAFISKFPNINIEVLNTQLFDPSGENDSNFIASFLEKEKPDVLWLSLDDYERLSDEKKLVDLDVFVQQDKFDLEGIHPAILKLLRDRSGGKLNGLAPMFNSEVLLYNKDLFQKHGIQPPTDSMSWDEVLMLARQFQSQKDGDNQVYGFGLPLFNTYSGLAYTVGTTNGLALLSPDGKQVTLNTEGWKNAFQSVADAVKAKAIGLSEQPEMQTFDHFYREDPFISGKIAMKMGNSFDPESLKQAKDEMDEGEMPNWGMVTAPVDPVNRGQSQSFSINQILAVNHDSPNIKAAWEFVKFVNSEEFARIRSKLSLPGTLLSRTAFIPDIDGMSMEPFYKLEPSSRSKGLDIGRFNRLFASVMDDEFQQVLDGKKSIEEALAEMERQAQEKLIKEELENNAAS
jgi:multiple sugar transport system substrate-binding protein